MHMTANVEESFLKPMKQYVDTDIKAATVMTSCP